MPVCPFCGTDNPATALICELCKRSLRRHKNRWKRWGALIAMVVLLVVTVFTIEYLGHKAETLKMAQRQKAALELISSYGYHTRSANMVVEGKVRNISSQKLQGVYAVVTWHSKDDQLVARDRASLQADPFFNYQTSAFAVKIPHKPGMDRYAVSFETEDGTVLLTADTRTAHEELTFSSEKE